MNVYEMVTQQIIEKLEAGTVPRHQPWAMYGDGSFRNGISPKPYRGIDVLLLCGHGYESPDFFSFKQVRDLGAHVRAGEKSHVVTFWKLLDRPDQEKKIPLLRYYGVFNREQCEGLPAPKDVLMPLERDGTPLGSMDMLIAAIAMEHKATLITNNIKHFGKISCLKMETWQKQH